VLVAAGGSRARQLAGSLRRVPRAGLLGAADLAAGSLAGALACVARGAAIVRVHDVAATVDALKVWRAVEKGLSA